jgi:hypothetical protein
MSKCSHQRAMREIIIDIEVAPDHHEGDTTGLSSGDWPQQLLGQLMRLIRYNQISAQRQSQLSSIQGQEHYGIARMETE